MSKNYPVEVHVDRIANGGCEYRLSVGGTLLPGVGIFKDPGEGFAEGYSEATILPELLAHYYPKD